jgi:hypothetical protein
MANLDFGNAGEQPPLLLVEHSDREFNSLLHHDRKMVDQLGFSHEEKQS